MFGALRFRLYKYVQIRFVFSSEVYLVGETFELFYVHARN